MDNIYKVYGMLLEVGNTLFLSVQYAGTLEEAISQAKIEFSRLNPPQNGKIEGFKITLFSFKDFEELIIENRNYKDIKLARIEQTVHKHHKIAHEEKKEKVKKPPVEVKKIAADPKMLKNILMKEIIEKKDLEMFKRNKKLFTAPEAKFLKAKLKK